MAYLELQDNSYSRKISNLFVGTFEIKVEKTGLGVFAWYTSVFFPPVYSFRRTRFPEELLH